MNIFSLLKRYLKAHTVMYTIAIIFIFLEVVVSSLQPKLIAQIIDFGIQEQNMKYVLRIGIVMLGLCVAGYIFGVLATVISGKISAEAGHVLRNDLFLKTMNAKIEQSNRVKKESIFNRISGDCSTVMEFIAEFIHIAIKPLILFVSGLIMLLSINLTFSLVLLIAIIIELTLELILYNKTVNVFAEIQLKIDVLVKYLRQNIIGARTVKIFSKEKAEECRYEKQNKSVTKETLGIWRFSAKMNALIMLVMNTVILIILVSGGVQAQQQPFKIGEILASITYSQQILMSLMTFGLFFKQLSGTKVAAMRVNEILEIRDENQRFQIDLDEEIKEIIFEKVSFYSDNNYYLKDVSFTLKKGETYGFWGGTASGKSLLIDLLTGVYPIVSGNILINGKKLSSFTPTSVRKHIAVATQEAELFSDTIEENILWGRDGNASKIAKMAHIEEFIRSLRLGYKTLLYDKGRNLSGGQRQRLQIARAFCADSDVFIVDDAISQTDIISRKIVLDNVFGMKKEKIVIIASQRPENLKKCSKILVFCKGQIVSIGSHSELSQKCELYQSFFDTQEEG